MIQDYLKYIVPVCQCDKILGTAFIVKDKLITAAHVLAPPIPTPFFIYEGEKVDLPLKKMIILESDEDDSQEKGRLHLDLLVYTIDGINSPLQFGEGKIGTNCSLFGYSENTLLNSLKIEQRDNIIISHKQAYTLTRNSPKRPVDNCFVSQESICINGNSGSPLFSEEYVVGMLVSSYPSPNPLCDKYIKSEYIVNRIIEETTH